MKRMTPIVSLIVVALVASVLTLGCAPSDPLDRLQQTRSEYEVQASSFYVRDEPIPGAAPTAETAEDETSGDAAQGNDEAAPEPVVPTQSVLSLDILVSTTAPEPIPGITVELEQIAPDGSTKSTRQIWLDTTGVQKGISATKTVKVEGIDYAEGDGFNVSVKSPIPAAEISNYAEFDGISP